MEMKLIGGVFRNEEDAVNAIQSLERSGHKKDDISVFVKNKEIADHLSEETDINTSGDKDQSSSGKDAGKGAGIGAGSGVVLGGAIGLGLLAIPGAGPIAAAGPLAAAIQGGTFGAASGGIAGALTGAGVSKEDADEYEKYLEQGNIVLLVEADENQQENVYRIFTTHNTANAGMYPEGVRHDNN
ncbi:general stress protein [Marinococcus halotolerans]|uniref:general stress protein n=1 Tax=Marinococcus halotolerans TaxID=301092 RepID=UPI0003B4F39F|nr:general stress protein [Marinococcus halotolerans]